LYFALCTTIFSILPFLIGYPAILNQFCYFCKYQKFLYCFFAYYNKAILKISESNFNIGEELMIIMAFGIAFFLASLYLNKERKSQV
jgi:hypothetical protein